MVYRVWCFGGGLIDEVSWDLLVGINWVGWIGLVCRIQFACWYLQVSVCWVRFSCSGFLGQVYWVRFNRPGFWGPICWVRLTE